MKTSKQILVIILLVFLTFSCNKDDKAVDNIDTEDLYQTGAGKYLLKENSKYTYLVEFYHKLEDNKDSLEITTNQIINFEGKKGLKLNFANNKVIYLSSEKDVMYFYGDFLEIDTINKKEWLTLFDLNKKEWIIYSDTLTNEESNETIIRELKGEFLNETTFRLNGYPYPGIQVEYTSNFSIGYFQNNNFIPIHSTKGVEVVLFAEELGFVLENSLKLYYVNEIEEMHKEVYMELKNIEANE